MPHYIYKITNKQNGKMYVGQTRRTVEIRFKTHCQRINKTSLIQKAIFKYAKENFEVETLETLFDLSQEEVNKIEEKYIAEFNTVNPNGYNILATVNSKYVGGCTTEESIQKIRKSGQAFFKRNPEHFKKITELAKQRLKDPVANRVKEWKRLSNNRYLLTSPEGLQFCTYGLKCMEEYGLKRTSLVRVAKGILKSTGGWKCESLKEGYEKTKDRTKYLASTKKYEIYHKNGFSFCSYGLTAAAKQTGCLERSLRYSMSERCKTKSHKGWSILAA